MARHRDGSAVRKISRGPIIAVVAVVIVVLGVVGWFQLRAHTGEQGQQAAATCVSGRQTLPISADATIAPALSALARAYNATGPVIRDHCITAAVTAADSAATFAALTAPTPPGGQPAATPALWVPQSTLWTDRLAAVNPQLVSGAPDSVASTPVVLAVAPPVAKTLAAHPPAWRDLPRLQSDPHALDASGLPGWGGLRLAMPTGPGSDATALAATAVATATAGPGPGPLTEAAAHSAPVTAAVATLASAAPHPAPPTTAVALTALRTQTDAATAPLHAVPVTAQQLYRATEDNPGAALAELVPTGAAPMADYPAIQVGGPNVDETMARAASAFVEYIRRPEQQQTLAAAGFLVDAGGATMPTSAAVAFTRPEQTMAAPTAAATTAVGTVLANPSPGAATTILLDISGSMSTDEGGQTRLRNTTDDLARRIGALPDSADVGLRVFSAALDGPEPWVEKVPSGPLSDRIGSQTRRQSLDTALNGLSPATSTHTYPSLQDAYDDAVAHYAPGKPNSVLLITDGPNDDDAYKSSSTLLANLEQAADPAKPVRVDVITIGDNPDLTTLQAVAAQTGGTVRTVTGSAGPALGDAVTALLQ
ncbi:VWA domain-containing protein [Speluncibacter jeojiensis]|uniref:VWA domain-containing protein n=1 Tax=Speluncibacter jeojiensis TaxID=2710754 RepID=A0A9X4RD43_9ACTN|nr:VWA domain-containing protein [Corynebacteriales bacterium D3-21]